MMKHKKLIYITLLLPCLFLNTINAADLKSGSEYISSSTREMQNDEFANPGMKAVEEGKVEFHRPGVNEKTCATCHGENGSKFDLKKLPAIPYITRNLKNRLPCRNKSTFAEKSTLITCLMFMTVSI